MIVITMLNAFKYLLVVKGADEGRRVSCTVPSEGQFSSIFLTLKRHNLRDKSQSSERVTT